ncbi:MAG: ChbG/HpnK family deacetylase [Acidobacteriota bacterium]
MTEPRIIVTADDLGADAVINRAIVGSLRDGQATHASLLVNMAGFEEACALAHQAHVADRIGLHLNLTEGQPISTAMRDCPRFCTDGIFRFPARFSGLVPLTRPQAGAAADEIRQQIILAREQGFPLTHLDSHHHIHAELSMSAVVLSVAREMGIPRVRPASNCGTGNGPVRRFRHAAYNGRLSASGLRATRYFGAIDDVVWMWAQAAAERDRSAEVMIHPTSGLDGIVLDGTTVQPLAQKLSELHAARARA